MLASQPCSSPSALPSRPRLTDAHRDNGQQAFVRALDQAGLHRVTDRQARNYATLIFCGRRADPQLHDVSEQQATEIREFTAQFKLHMRNANRDRNRSRWR